MWLTLAVMALRRNSRYTPGRQFSGKHRKYRPVTSNMVYNMVKRLDVEKENESYLCKPYLTMSEEDGHAKEQNALEFKELQDFRRHKNMKPHRYLADHFSHLESSKHW